MSGICELVQHWGRLTGDVPPAWCAALLQHDRRGRGSDRVHDDGDGDDHQGHLEKSAQCPMLTMTNITLGHTTRRHSCVLFKLLYPSSV
jgi:hypothetical protein